MEKFHLYQEDYRMNSGALMSGSTTISHTNMLREKHWKLESTLLRSYPEYTIILNKMDERVVNKLTQNDGIIKN